MLVLVGTVMSSCMLSPQKSDLDIEIPATYRNTAGSTADSAVPALDWWHGFRSQELTSLIEAAQTDNLDVAVAIAQILQADAQVGISRAPLFPSLTGTATAEGIRSPASPRQRHRPSHLSAIRARAHCELC